MTRRYTLALPAVLTVVIHAALGGGLYAAGLLVERTVPPEPPIEVEIVELPPPPPPPQIEPPPEPPPPEPPKVVEAKPPKPRIRPKPRKIAPKPPPAEPPPEPPAPGPVISQDAPAPVIKLPGIAPSGTGPPVAVGVPTTRKVGRGGTGTNTGGAGGKPGGTGGPRPVSIASIKTRAMPLNADLDAGKMYPPEAKRLGVEGKLKVRLVVDENGRVTQRRLLTRLGYGLDELALTLAKRLRFKPAISTANQPVASVVVWTFDFVLPE